jgi:hypothetical protein
VLESVLERLQLVEGGFAPGSDIVSRLVIRDQYVLQLTESRSDRFENGMLRLELRLLRNERDAQRRRAPHRAVVLDLLARDHFHEARLAAAIAADQRYALGRIQRQICVIEKGGIAEREGCLFQGDERQLRTLGAIIASAECIFRRESACGRPL